MSLPTKYYLSTNCCARAEIQVFQLEDGKILHVIHPDNLFDFICLNSDKVRLIDYNRYIQSQPDSVIEEAVKWFKKRFSGQISLGALPDFPRNRNS